jgi:hypothetical protein
MIGLAIGAYYIVMASPGGELLEAAVFDTGTMGSNSTIDYKILALNPATFDIESHKLDLVINDTRLPVETLVGGNNTFLTSSLEYEGNTYHVNVIDSDNNTKYSAGDFIQIRCPDGLPSDTSFTICLISTYDDIVVVDGQKVMT